MDDSKKDSPPIIPVIYLSAFMTPISFAFCDNKIVLFLKLIFSQVKMRYEDKKVFSTN